MSGMQAQCWFCPICFEDRNHQPGDEYCIKEQAAGYKAMRVENEELRARVAELEGTINAVGEAFGTGSAARTRGTLVTCAENTVKFTKCLNAVERFFMVPGEPDDDYPDWEVDDVCLLNHWANSPEEYAEQFRVEILRKQADAVNEVAEGICIMPPETSMLVEDLHDLILQEVQRLRNDAGKAGGDV